MGGVPITTDSRGQHESPTSLPLSSSLLRAPDALPGRPPPPDVQPRIAPRANSPPRVFAPGTSSLKRKRTHFEVDPVGTPDVVAMGLISMNDAESYFGTFCQGCHQYVPVFDPHFDSLQGIRSRSGILFSTICAAGCRILAGADSNSWRMLNFHIKRVLNAVMGTPASSSLETIQALLVRACYTSERSLLVTVATRLAIELGLPEAYEKVSARCISRSNEAGPETGEDDVSLLRKTRTWLHLLNLGHILHVDAGDLLTFRFRGDVRRCRILLENALSTDLDLHLISQVELNAMRASTYSALANAWNQSDDEIMEVIEDAKIDIDVWFNDWLRIFERTSSQKRWLALHLRIQQCWADTMVLCRAVRVSGVENVDAMSPTQKDILLMAKNALEKHLHIIIEEPRDYLSNLRFAMDFVWAKCAFCFLLLLKLSMLLPEENEQTRRKLVEHGQILLSELRSAGGNGTGTQSTTGRVYLQLLQTGLEKFSRTVLHENLSQGEAPLTGMSTPRQGTGASMGSGQHNELESFVPEQFVFEWDFPGLTLFSSPTTEAGWLDDFLKSALIGGEEFFGFGWNSADVSEQSTTI